MWACVHFADLSIRAHKRANVRVYVHMSVCRSMCANVHALSPKSESQDEMFGSMQDLPHADVGHVSPENGALIIVEAQIV